MLTLDHHFEVMAGWDVEVKLFRAVDGNKTVYGVLVGKEEGELVLNSDSGEIRLEMKNVAKVTTVYDWQAAMKD